MSQVGTIGHSNVDRGKFETLLETASINVIADVRSTPSSRLPHINRAALNSRVSALGTAGIMAATREPQLQRDQEADRG